MGSKRKKKVGVFIDNDYLLGACNLYKVGTTEEDRWTYDTKLILDAATSLGGIVVFKRVYGKFDTMGDIKKDEFRNLGIEIVDRNDYHRRLTSSIVSREEIFDVFRSAILSQWVDELSEPHIQKVYRKDGTLFAKLTATFDPFSNIADRLIYFDAMRCALFRPSINIFVIVSGDGDFVQLYDALIEVGKKIVVIGVEENTSKEVKEHLFVRFIDYRDLQDIIKE